MSALILTAAIVDRVSKPAIMRFGMVTWSADDGHIRQNEYSVSSPRKYGIMKTVIARKMYLSDPAHFGMVNLTDFTLYNTS